MNRKLSPREVTFIALFVMLVVTLIGVASNHMEAFSKEAKEEFALLDGPPNPGGKCPCGKRRVEE